jgi:hypothetical protein
MGLHIREEQFQVKPEITMEVQNLTQYQVL